MNTNQQIVNELSAVIANLNVELAIVKVSCQELLQQKTELEQKIEELTAPVKKVEQEEKQD